MPEKHYYWMHCLTYCLTQPEHAVSTFIHTQPLNTHCLPHSLHCALLAINTSGTSSASVCARAHARIYAPITRDDQWLRSLRKKIFERKTSARRTAARRDGAFEDRSLYRLLNKASHLTAFCAWYGSPHLPVTPAQLMRPPAHWVTLHCNI